MHVARQFLPPEGQQRSQNGSPFGCHCRQTGGTAAMQHPKQHRFGLVVTVVGGDDVPGGLPNTDFFQPLIPALASESLGGCGAQREVASDAPETVRFREFFHLSGNRSALGVNAVVHMGDQKIQSVRVDGRDEQIEQRDGIRPARDGDECGEAAGNGKRLEMVEEASEHGGKIERYVSDRCPGDSNGRASRAQESAYR